MRIEYTFGLASVDVPRFSVDATEGLHKLFTLATLVLNVLCEKPRIDIVFHSQNPDDPQRKIQTFQKIVDSTPGGPSHSYQPGPSGSFGGTHYSWLSIQSSGGRG
jgi:hypothetical protein